MTPPAAWPQPETAAEAALDAAFFRLAEAMVAWSKAQAELQALLVPYCFGTQPHPPEPEGPAP